MAKLVDALCSGRSARKGVLVRIQFWARKPYKLPVYKVFSFKGAYFTKQVHPAYFG